MLSSSEEVLIAGIRSGEAENKNTSLNELNVRKPLAVLLPQKK
jgi:hypothetical protein